MGKLVWICILLAYVTIPASTEEGSTAKLRCSTQLLANKIGCYKEQPGMTLISSSRDNSDTLFAGYFLNWKNLKRDVARLVCDCDRLARKKGYKYFSLRFWAECWAGNSYETGVVASNCVNNERKLCGKADRDCIGTVYSEYVYKATVPTTTALCAEKGVNYAGYDIMSYLNTPSWKACSNHCRDLLRCNKWTWFTAAFPDVNAKKKCQLKRSSMGKVTLSNSISGDRICGAKSCAEKGIDYAGGDMIQKLNTPSWKACSDHCRNVLRCWAWTWLTEAFPDGNAKKTCFLKWGFNHRRSLSNSISGLRLCGATSCGEKDIDYPGSDIKQYPDTPTWEACSDHCRNVPKCNAWSWLTGAFPDVDGQKKCHLKGGINGRKSLSNVISGARKCGGRPA